jgi:hypothetical protein
MAVNLLVGGPIAGLIERLAASADATAEVGASAPTAIASTATTIDTTRTRLAI